MLSHFFFSTYQLNHPLKHNSDHLPPLLNTIHWFFISRVYSKVLMASRLYMICLLPTFMILFLAFSLLAHCSTATLATRVSLKCAKHIAFPLSSHILSELALILSSDLCWNSSLLSSLCWRADLRWLSLCSLLYSTSHIIYLFLGLASPFQN